MTFANVFLPLGLVRGLRVQYPSSLCHYLCGTGHAAMREPDLPTLSPQGLGFRV